MNSVLTVVAALGILLGPVRAQPAIYQPVRDDENRALAKIEREIAKEPPYRTAPKYCLALFGPSPKTRVWLVVDDDTLYADLNGNGDLTESGEKLQLPQSDLGRYGPPCLVGDIADAETKLTHTGFTVGHWGAGEYRLAVTAGYGRTKVRSLYGFATVAFGAKPMDAPIVHFGGRLSMGLSIATIGDRPAFVCAEVGTPGLGKGSFVYYTAAVVTGVGAQLRPEIEVEYAGEKDAVVRDKAKFRKDGFENVYLFPVNPGGKDDNRKVKITLSFYDLWAIDVAERSFARPVITLGKE